MHAKEELHSFQNIQTTWCLLSNSHIFMLLAMQFVVIKYLVNQVPLLFILPSTKRLLSMYLVDRIDLLSFYSNCDWKWTEFPNFQLTFTWFQKFFNYIVYFVFLTYAEWLVVFKLSNLDFTCDTVDVDKTADRSRAI